MPRHWSPGRQAATHRPLLIAGAFAAFLGLGIAAPGLASEEIIREVEGLRDALPPSEKSQRRDLTRRLADLHYSEALELAVEDPVKNDARVTGHRARSVRLYEELVLGENGRYDPLVGEDLAVARFQLARLYADSDQLPKAHDIWEDLIKLTNFPKLVSESALSLAESFEAKDAASPRAAELYQLALKNSSQHDTRVYAHYRRAWILRNQNVMRGAIQELGEALWDSKGQVKDEALQDLLVFHALSDTPPKEAISFFESLGRRLARPELISLLADAYIANGNKAAAVATLAVATSKNDDPVRLVRLLEEAYGMRDWAAYGEALGRATTIKLPDQDKQAEVHKILARLAVQLDAESQTAAEHASVFIHTAELFARLFPKDEVTFKMLAGAVSRTADPAAKTERVRRILGDDTLALSNDQKLTLQEELVRLLQKQGDKAGAAAAATVAVTLTNKTDDQRRFRFVAASELYDSGEVEAALPALDALAQENATDDIGRKSAMLAIKARGKKADYAGALASSATWLAAAGKDEATRASKEYVAVVEVRDRAEFEWAVGKGDDPGALDVFAKNCLGGTFTPAACDNAKGVAARLKRFDTLFAILAHQNNTDELAALHEANGYFGKAAEHYEKKLLADDSATTKNFLYVALLYEIDGRDSDRDRVLNRLSPRFVRQAVGGPEEEALIFDTMKEAGLLTDRVVSWRWSDEFLCQVADYVYQRKPQKALEERLFACKVASGRGWSDAVLKRVGDLEAKQGRLSFYGRDSKRRFERRMAAILEYAKEVDRFLPAADHTTYLKLAGNARDAFEALRREIENTPIPSETPPDIEAEVKAALATMAAPFVERAAGYAKVLADEEARPAPNVAETSPTQPQALDRAALGALFSSLHQDPENPQIVANIQELYAASGQKRQAAYFRGRLQRLDVKSH